MWGHTCTANILPSFVQTHEATPSIVASTITFSVCSDVSSPCTDGVPVDTRKSLPSNLAFTSFLANSSLTRDWYSRCLRCRLFFYCTREELLSARIISFHAVFILLPKVRTQSSNRLGCRRSFACCDTVFLTSTKSMLNLVDVFACIHIQTLSLHTQVKQIN